MDQRVVRDNAGGREHGPQRRPVDVDHAVGLNDSLRLALAEVALELGGASRPALDGESRPMFERGRKQVRTVADTEEVQPVGPAAFCLPGHELDSRRRGEHGHPPGACLLHFARNRHKLRVEA